jgi:hypothetical protein
MMSFRHRCVASCFFSLFLLSEHNNCGTEGVYLDMHDDMNIFYSRVEEGFVQNKQVLLLIIIIFPFQEL